MKEKLQVSELVLHDGMVYHLRVRPENIGDTIILVGDQSRVGTVSKYFDSIDYKGQNREFVTHTGTLANKRITAMSTGIGTDNIDIVINELDALVNIDLQSREFRQKHTSLKLVRIGTTGSLQASIPTGGCIISKLSAGFDNTLQFYSDLQKFNRADIAEKFIQTVQWNDKIGVPYFVEPSPVLFDKLNEGFYPGMTISAPGFYGPQGRQLRLQPLLQNLNTEILRFSFDGLSITNYEMECSALYGLAKMLNHHAATVCAVIANRATKQFINDYSTTIENLVQTVLERLTKE